MTKATSDTDLDLQSMRSWMEQNAYNRYGPDTDEVGVWLRELVTGFGADLVHQCKCQNGSVRLIINVHGSQFGINISKLQHEPEGDDGDE